MRDHLISSNNVKFSKFDLSDMLKKHVFGSFNLNNSEKYRLSLRTVFLGTLDTYTKKMSLPRQFWGRGCTVRSAGSEPIWHGMARHGMVWYGNNIFDITNIHVHYTLL